MSYRKSVAYMICLFFALTIFFALDRHAKVAQALPITPIATDTLSDQPEKLLISSGVEARLVVDTDKRTLSVMAGQEVIGIYPVAIGKQGTPTPIGEWKIIDKDYDWGGPFGARWIGLNIPWGRYGIHGTNQPWTISSEASLGCLRMFDDDILHFFDLVKVGTQVDIVGPPHETNLWRRELGAGSVGPDAVYVQLALKKRGFYPYRCDGIFGRLSDLGVRCFQAVEGLPVTGKVDEETDRRLLAEVPETSRQIELLPCSPGQPRPEPVACR